MDILILLSIDPADQTSYIPSAGEMSLRSERAVKTRKAL